MIGFIPSGRREKILSILCTAIIIAGVAIEHVADSYRFAPRTLTLAQQNRIADELKQYPGQEFAGQVASSVPDAWPLWVTLDKTLRSANWVREPPWGLAIGNPPAGVPVAANDGVTVFVSATDVTSLAPVVNALTSALNKEGIKAIAAPSAGPQTRPGILVIEIGTKPQ